MVSKQDLVIVGCNLGFAFAIVFYVSFYVTMWRVHILGCKCVTRYNIKLMGPCIVTSIYVKVAIDVFHNQIVVAPKNLLLAYLEHGCAQREIVQLLDLLVICMIQLSGRYSSHIIPNHSCPFNLSSLPKLLSKDTLYEILTIWILICFPLPW